MCRTGAFLKRDLATEMGSRASVLLQALHVAVGVASYFLLVRHVDANGPGSDTFSFLLLGMALNGCMTTAVVCFSQAVRNSQATGTLKMVVAAPMAPAAWLAYSAVYPLGRAAADGLVYLTAGAALGFSLGHANVGAMLLVAVASMLAFAGLGVIAGACTVAFRRSAPIVSVFLSLSWLLGGVFYPQDVLPAGLRMAARWVPMTHATQAMRAAALDGLGVADLGPSLSVLLLFASITLCVGVGAFHAALHRARRIGSLSHA